MRLDGSLKHQASQLALVNQSSFLLASLALLHLSRALLPLLQSLVLWLSAVFAIVGFQQTMNTQVNQTPDLAMILRTLASFTPTPHYPQPQPQPSAQEAGVQGGNDLEEGEYEPEEYNPSSYDPSPPTNTQQYPHIPPAQPPPLEAIYQAPQHHQPPPLEPHPQPPPTPWQQPPLPPAIAKKPHSPAHPPPAKITTWPPALRSITTRTSSDPQFSPKIRHLIKTQHTHERQWWHSRLDLVQKLEGRNERKRKLDSLLSSIGGKVGPSTNANGELSPEKELEIFDRKVHRACRQMVAATTEELGRLEVPFFCTLRALVTEKGKVKRTGTLGGEELVGLQGKMLELLEDLCGEELLGQEGE